MKKYNLSEIMHKAWKLYRKGAAAFAECLHRAWNSAKAAPVNAQRIEEAQQTAGITEPVNTWGGLESRRYMVSMVQRLCFRRCLSTAARETARPTGHRSSVHRRCSRWKSSNTNRDPRRKMEATGA